MNKIPFQDGIKMQEAYVTIDGQNHAVTPAVWSGTTPVSSLNLNNMQNNIENAINEQTDIKNSKITIESTISANTDYTIPLNYKVGNNSLEVFYCGSKLEKRIRLQ